MNAIRTPLADVLKSALIVFIGLLLFCCAGLAQSPAITGLLVNGVASNVGPVGATLTINGSNFGSTEGASTVTLNTLQLAGTEAKAQSWSSNSIVVTIPSGASSGPVQVKVLGKPLSNTMQFDIGPVITEASPASAVVGSSLTITGQGFGSATGTVTFSGASASTTLWESGQIDAVVPSGVTAGPIVVTNSGGQASNGVPFTPTPSISSLSPPSGLSGTTVTVAGSGFGSTAGTVSFNGVAATVNSWNNGSISVTAPGGALTGPVVVSVNGFSSAGVVFTFTPQITGLSPSPVLAEAPLTIQGINFGGQQNDSTITLNGQSPTVTGWNNTSITVTAPANVTAGAVVVTVNGVASNSFALTLQRLYSFGATYAPDSRLLSFTDTANGAWTYGYDNFGHLATASNSSPTEGFSFTYDEYDSRWGQVVTAGSGTSESLTFTPASTASTNGNCYQAAGPTNQPNGFCFDAAGNLLNDGVHTYAYDAENRLISVDGGRTATYAYDADGYRIQRPEGSDYYDPSGRIITEIGPSGTWNFTELYAGGRDLGTYANGTTNFLYRDLTGTKRMVVDPSGDVSQICTGFAFGDGVNCVGVNSISGGFTNDVLDTETNLEHTWFRQYSSAQARWLTPDPAGIAAADPTNPQSWNQYAYVMNDPTNETDPLGLQDSGGGGVGLGPGPCFDCIGGSDPFPPILSPIIPGIGGLGILPGETSGIPSGIVLPGPIQTLLADLPWNNPCIMSPISDGCGFGNGLQQSYPSNGGITGQDVDCSAAAAQAASAAKAEFDSHREKRFFVSVARGAAFGFATGLWFEKVSLTLPFVGPFVAIESAPEILIVAPALGGLKGALGNLVIDPLRGAATAVAAAVGTYYPCKINNIRNQIGP